MSVAGEILVALPLNALMNATALGGSITGAVTRPDGGPYMGAFVAPAEPDDGVCALGYAGSVALAADATASLDFALKKTPARWSDLSTYQGRQHVPKTKDHDLSYKNSFFTTCFQSCHSFQKRMATQSLDLEDWRTRVRYMSDAMLEGRHLSDTTVGRDRGTARAILGQGLAVSAFPLYVPV
jgi:cytochrome c5